MLSIMLTLTCIHDVIEVGSAGAHILYVMLCYIVWLVVIDIMLVLTLLATLVG